MESIHRCHFEILISQSWNICLQMVRCTQLCLVRHWEKSTSTVLSLSQHNWEKKKKKKCLPIGKVLAGLIQNRHWIGPNIFSPWCLCSWMDLNHLCKILVLFKGGKKFSSSLINQLKTFFLLTLDLAPSVIKVQLICARCKF